MKSIINVLLFSILTSLTFAQNQCIEKFYDQYKDLDKVTSINLTGNLLNFIFTSDNENEPKTSKINSLHVLLVEEGDIVRYKDYKSFMRSIKKEQFEPLVSIKEKDDVVDFYLKETENIITNVLITVRGDDGFIMLSLEGLFDYEDLKDFDLDIEGGEHLKKLPKDRETIKRA